MNILKITTHKLFPEDSNHSPTYPKHASPMLCMHTVAAKRQSTIFTCVYLQSMKISPKVKKP